MTITSLAGEAYVEALRQTALLHNRFGYQYNVNEHWYELEDWAECAELQFDEEGNLI